LPPHQIPAVKESRRTLGYKMPFEGFKFISSASMEQVVILRTLYIVQKSPSTLIFTNFSLLRLEDKSLAGQISQRFSKGCSEHAVLKKESSFDLRHLSVL